VHEHDGHRAFPYRRRDSLRRLGPHVAGHEHAGDAALEVVRLTVKRPAAFFLGEVRACQHEAVLVASQHAV
jgi:hypothetical protein